MSREVYGPDFYSVTPSLPVMDKLFQDACAEHAEVFPFGVLVDICLPSKARKDMLSDELRSEINKQMIQSGCPSFDSRDGRFFGRRKLISSEAPVDEERSRQNSPYFQYPGRCCCSVGVCYPLIARFEYLLHPSPDLIDILENR